MTLIVIEMGTQMTPAIPPSHSLAATLGQMTVASASGVADTATGIAHDTALVFGPMQSPFPLGESLWAPEFTEQVSSGISAGMGANFAIPGVTTFGATGFAVVPSLMIAERYDTNIYFAPSIAGLDREDFVTTVSPQLLIRDNGRLVTTSISGGVISEYYARNPRLSYLGFNGGANLALTGLVRRYIPGASLSLSYNYLYTPTPPAFLTGGQSLNEPLTQPEPGTTAPLVDTFVRGIQATRVNTTMHSASVGAAYIFSPFITGQLSYGYSTVTFGSQALAAQNPSLRQTTFNATNHTLSAGPIFRVTARDSLTLSYTYTKSQFSGSGLANFESHGANAGWTRTLRDGFSTNLNAGFVAVLLPQQNTGTTGRNGRSTFYTYTGGAALNWARRYTTVQLRYMAAVSPSYITSSGALLTNMVVATASQKITDRAYLSGGANYSHNGVIGGDQQGPAVNFQAFNAFGTLASPLASWLYGSLNYTFGYYTGTFYSTSNTAFTRHAITLMFTSYWKLL
jgi:hypothetical protein